MYFKGLFMQNEILDKLIEVSGLDLILKKTKAVKLGDRTIVEFFNIILSKEQVHKQLKKSIVFPLHKREDVAGVKNFGIFLL